MRDNTDDNKRVEAVKTGSREAKRLENDKNKKVQQANGAGVRPELKKIADNSMAQLQKKGQLNDPSKVKEAMDGAGKNMKQALGTEVAMGSGGDAFDKAMAYLNSAIKKAGAVGKVIGSMKKTYNQGKKLKSQDMVVKAQNASPNGKGFTQNLLKEVTARVEKNNKYNGKPEKATGPQIRERFNEALKDVLVKGKDGEPPKPLADKDRKAMELKDSDFKQEPQKHTWGPKKGEPKMQGDKQVMGPSNQLTEEASEKLDDHTIAQKGSTVASQPAQDSTDKTQKSDKSAQPKPTPEGGSKATKAGNDTSNDSNLSKSSNPTPTPSKPGGMSGGS